MIGFVLFGTETTDACDFLNRSLVIHSLKPVRRDSRAGKSVRKPNIKILELSITRIWLGSMQCTASWQAIHAIPYSLLCFIQRNAVRISIQKSNEKSYETSGIHNNQAQPHHNDGIIRQSSMHKVVLACANCESIVIYQKSTEENHWVAVNW